MTTDAKIQAAVEARRALEKAVEHAIHVTPAGSGTAAVMAAVDAYCREAQRDRIAELESLLTGALGQRDHLERENTTLREHLAGTRTAELEAQLAECQRKNADLAAAGARKHDAVCHFADAFSKPDDRRMRHASITESTIARWCAEAGILP